MRAAEFVRLFSLTSDPKPVGKMSRSLVGARLLLLALPVLRCFCQDAGEGARSPYCRTSGHACREVQGCMA